MCNDKTRPHEGLMASAQNGYIAELAENLSTYVFHSCHPSDQMYSCNGNMDSDFEYSRILHYDRDWHHILEGRIITIGYIK